MSGKIQLLNTCTCHLVGKIGLNWVIFKLNKCIDYEAHIRYFGQRIKKLSSKVFFCLSYLFAFLIWIYLQNVKLWGKERLLNSNYQYLVKLNLLAQNQNEKKRQSVTKMPGIIFMIKCMHGTQIKENTRFVMLKGHCHAIWQLYEKPESVFTSVEFQN